MNISNSTATAAKSRNKENKETDGSLKAFLRLQYISLFSERIKHLFTLPQQMKVICCRIKKTA